MNEHIIIGSITLPYSLSNTERLLWLEDWMYECAEGILVNRIIEVIFTRKEAIEDSIEFLVKNNTHWILMKDNEFLAPNGIIVRFHYDEEGDKLLSQIRNTYKND